MRIEDKGIEMIVEGKIFGYKKNIEKLFEVAGRVLGEDFSCVSVSVNFVGEEEIKRLNKQFRDVDRVTDVLSFPNLEKKADESLKNFESEKVDDVLFLGDIVICKKKAKAQAKEFGHSEKREICFLALHGLLHLLGFDHIGKDDEKKMNAVAEKILTQFGVKR